MVKDVTLKPKNIKLFRLKNIGDIQIKITLVEFSDKMKNLIKKLNFLKENMYNHNVVLSKTKEGMKIVDALFKKIIINPENL